METTSNLTTSKEDMHQAQLAPQEASITLERATKVQQAARKG